MRHAFEIDLGCEQLLVIPLREVAMTDVRSLLAGKVQREVARDAANGMSNTEIARKRGRAVRTIANHLAVVYRRLGIGSRSQLAVRLLGHKES